MKICKRTQTHGCVHTSASAIFNKNKIPVLFLPNIFQPYYFHPLCSCVYTAPLKIIHLFLPVCPSSSSSSYYPPSSASSHLPLSVFIWIPFFASSSLAILPFPSSSSVFSPSAPSLFSCSIPHIPVGFIRGRTPLADQGQTLLQCSQPLSVALSVSLILSVLFFSPRLSPKPLCSGPLILFLTFL